MLLKQMFHNPLPLPGTFSTGGADIQELLKQRQYQGKNLLSSPRPLSPRILDMKEKRPAWRDMFSVKERIVIGCLALNSPTTVYPAVMNNPVTDSVPGPGRDREAVPSIHQSIELTRHSENQWGQPTTMPVKLRSPFLTCFPSVLCSVQWFSIPTDKKDKQKEKTKHYQIPLQAFH